MKRIDLNLLLITLLALAGGLIILFNSPWGIGFSSDSVTYLQAARNLSAGLGLTLWSEGGFQPVTHFPPLYPLLLAAIQSCGFGGLAGARWLQAILFAANIASIGIIVWACTPGARWVGGLAAGLAFSSLALLEIHGMAWTEPLFLLFGMWGLFLLYKHFENPRPTLLVGSAGLVALAWLARYIGFALVVTAIFAILLLSHKTLRYRLFDALIFSLVSVIPIGIWLGRNTLNAGSSTDRQLVYHPISLAQLKAAVLVFTTWLDPQPLANSVRIWLALAGSAALLTCVYLLWRRKEARRRLRPAAFVGLFILSYLVSLGLSLSFIDSNTPLDNRILSPVFAASLLLAGCLVGVYAASQPLSRMSKMVILLCFIIIFGLSLRNGAAWMQDRRRLGLGYASPLWIQSELLEKLRSIPPGVPIFTNASEPIYLHTGLHATQLPPEYDPFTLLENRAFNDEMQQMGEKIRDHNGFLVIFDVITWRPYLPTEEEILQKLPLIPYVKGKDGTIYTGKAKP